MSATRTIHKFILLPGSSAVAMDPGARWLHVDSQRGTLTLWAEVDPAVETQPVPVALVMTGGTAPDDADYIGTALIDDGAVVVHVYKPIVVPTSVGDLIESIFGRAAGSA